MILLGAKRYYFRHWREPRPLCLPTLDPPVLLIPPHHLVTAFSRAAVRAAWALLPLCPHQVILPGDLDDHVGAVTGADDLQLLRLLQVDGTQQGALHGPHFQRPRALVKADGYLPRVGLVQTFHSYGGEHCISTHR